jgi:Icc-related predicted phosphoesterase
MTSIQIASDLHIECVNDNNIDPFQYITPSADILVLAGDIGSLYKIKQLQNFIKKLSYYFKIIIYVPGNHEYYYIDETDQVSLNILNERLFDLGDMISNLHILNCNSILIDNLCIAGCTLWSKPECKVPNFIVRIPEFNTSNYFNQHKKDLKYIVNIMKYCKNKKYKLLMITHHPPTQDVLKDTNRRKKYISLYSTNLNYLLDNKYISTWICGHIHKNFDFYSSKGCRILGNQMGKPKDGIKDYDPGFTIIL